MTEPINEPLGLPRGSVRSMLALLVVASFVLVQTIGTLWLLVIAQYEVAAILATALAVEAANVIGWYFVAAPSRG